VLSPTCLERPPLAQRDDLSVPKPLFCPPSTAGLAGRKPSRVNSQYLTPSSRLSKIPARRHEPARAKSRRRGPPVSAASMIFGKSKLICRSLLRTGASRSGRRRSARASPPLAFLIAAQVDAWPRRPEALQCQGCLVPGAFGFPERKSQCPTSIGGLAQRLASWESRFITLSANLTRKRRRVSAASTA